jgi:hypothetical protein
MNAIDQSASIRKYWALTFRFTYNGVVANIAIDPQQALNESRIAITQVRHLVEEATPFLKSTDENEVREWHFLIEDQLNAMKSKLEVIRDRLALGTQMTLDAKSAKALDWLAMNAIAISQNLHRLTEPKQVLAPASACWDVGPEVPKHWRTKEGLLIDTELPPKAFLLLDCVWKGKNHSAPFDLISESVFQGDTVESKLIQDHQKHVRKFLRKHGLIMKTDKTLRVCFIENLASSPNALPAI